ncbi:MAG: WcaF family extracellular polysaccharide biosynthesis acetyltransferase [Pseudomonadota bacterium]
MRLDTFNNGNFDRGRSRGVEVLWLVCGRLVASSLPGSAWRRLLLRGFGARMGKGVVIKPRVRIKFPWRLSVGEYSWLGEGSWIDNLATVTIGSHCCVSQGVYLCTGSHDWSKSTFDLITQPITVGDAAWLAACCRIAPGVTIGEGAVIQLGAVLTSDANPHTRYGGNPARALGPVRSPAPESPPAVAPGGGPQKDSQ